MLYFIDRDPVAMMFVRVCVIALMVTCTVCQQRDICGYATVEPVSSETFGYLPQSQLSDEGACRCVVTPVPDVADMKTYIDITTILHLTEDVKDEDCKPLMLVSISEVSGSLFSKSEDFHVCPSEQASDHKSMVNLFPGQEAIFHLSNPQEAALDSMITVDAGPLTKLSIKCEPYSAIVYDHCPCATPVVVVPDTATGGLNENRRLMIGLVTAFLFLLVIVAIIVGWVFYKKRKAKAATVEKEAVTVENRGFQGSKQSVGDNKNTPVEKVPKVSYTPDPTLNLDLQQPGNKGYHGSRDSGLASGNEDKRLPFMQSGTGSSLDNLTQMPVNYPALAGGGSQSSLDNVPIEPTYTSHGPRAGHPDNYPSLAGHGSQSSLDNLGRNPADADVYANIRRPPRSASHDQLNMDAVAARAEEESLNASRVTIETDV